ncbi:MAG: hypothetical protein WBQ24_14815 [Xanthobacteraceae bacterium]|jgi:hypothetical protein
MSRRFCLSIAVLLSLLPGVATADPPHAKQSIHRWHGYGFLPGYHQPPSNSVPIYSHRTAARNSPSYDAPGFAAPGSSFPNYGTPSYWWDGSRYYFGNPGFYHGRFNGGSFGPCWTYTPIGAMWNCG